MGQMTTREAMYVHDTQVLFSGDNSGQLVVGKTSARPTTARARIY